MNENLKNRIIVIYFLSYYLTGILIDIFSFFPLLFGILYIFFEFYKNSMLNYVLLKTIFFSVSIFIVFCFDRIIIMLTLCGMNGFGYLQRNGIVEHSYSCSDFTFNETMLLNFISTLYYPIYIFIFFKPFVNHLDKSIKKIKEKQNNKK